MATLHPMTTRRNESTSLSGNADSVIPMTSMRKRSTGRPSLGPRRQISTRIPVEVADRIDRLSLLTGTPMGQIVAELVVKHSDEIDPDALEAGADQPRMTFEEGTRQIA
jgi:predicted DNA-binding protein